MDGLITIAAESRDALAVDAEFDFSLFPGATEQFVERCDDGLPLFGQRTDWCSELINGNRHHLKWMQHDLRAANAKGRVEGGKGCRPDAAGTHQWHDYAAPVVIKLGRLHDHHVGNRVCLPPRIAMNIELRHQSVENSSAIEPLSLLKVFQTAAVVSEMRWRLRRSSRCCSR